MCDVGGLADEITSWPLGPQATPESLKRHLSGGQMLTFEKKMLSPSRAIVAF